jgi:Transposase and inactivated derivatives
MQNAEIFIGLDMGKSSFSAAVVAQSNPSTYYEEQFTNDKNGYLKLLQWLKKTYPDDGRQVLICLEHTGIYSRGICLFLAERQMPYTLLSGLHLKRSMGIRRGKTDKADAKAISKYALIHKHEIRHTVLPEKALLKLKDKIAERDRMVKAKKLLSITANEHKSVGLKVTKADLIHTQAVVERITKAIKALEKEIESLIKSDDQMKKCLDLLCSIPGIGLQIAAQLLVTTHCFTCFDNSRQLACYAGLAPFEYSSGSSIRGRTKVSHLADKKIKSLLSMAALNAMRYDKQLKQYYARKTAEGKHVMVVQNAIRNKVLARAFAVIKRGTPYVQLATYA